MAVDKSDDPGVLGNLPKTRPGRRSDKRASGARAKPSPEVRAKTAAARVRSAQGAPKPAVSSASKPRPRSRPAVEQPPRRTMTQQREQASSSSSDPLTGAVKLAGKVAEVPLKTAGGILKRLTGR